MSIYNNGITTLNGLSSLGSVGEYVLVQYNNSLTSMNSFITAINSVGQYVNISQNPMLSTCQVSAFVASLNGYTGTTTNTGNLTCAAGCNGAMCGP